MSRRKQSNPKPLKREDEEDNPTGDEKSTEKSQSPNNNTTTTGGDEHISPQHSPTSTVSNESTNNNHSTTPPRVRLNPSLATDPALRSEEISSSPDSPQPPPPPPPQHLNVVNRSAAELEYLASLPPGLQQALAGRLFPDTPHITDGGKGPPTARTKHDPPTVIETRSVPVFVCSPCGIRFSSASTLEAHQTYYCSHRVQAKTRNESDGDDPKSPQTTEGGPENATKSLRTGKQYECPHCSYSADKKVSLNRHMRMHSSSPATHVPVILPSPHVNGVVEVPTTELPQLVDRYCQDCDIRFSSVKTFRAHKVHYCSSRHAKGSPTSKTSSTPTSPSDTQRLSPEPAFQPLPNRTFRSQQPFLALRTNPVLIVPYSLFQSASLFTGAGVQNLPTQDAACILLPNGTLQPMAHLVSPKEQSRTPNQSHHVTEQVLKMRDEPKNGRGASGGRGKTESSTPLDLSVRRSSESSDLVIDMEDEKENVYSSSPDHEDIVCAPSIPSILHGASPQSPDDKKHSETYSNTPSPVPSSSPTTKRSPRRTPNGLNNRKNDNKQKDKKLNDLDYQANINLLMAAVAGGSAGDNISRRSAGGKNISMLPLPLPMLLSQRRSPGASPELLPLLNSTELPHRIHGLSNTSESTIPQVLVKQGVSKCQECNIVFCKHENYIAHKKHYCSARLPEDLTTDEQQQSRTSPNDVKSPSASSTSSLARDGNPTSPKNQTQANNGSKTQTIYQFICVACGIKFTALDNLTAHQTYYCPKRPNDSSNKQPDDKARRCTKCRILVSGDHQCINQVSVVNGWKCPCCDVVSPTAAAAQKHMDTHSGVKAFRCTICRYKGNTLRGMRTHIRMHFDKKNSDLQEENFIACIGDDDNTNESPTVPAVGGATPNGIQETSQVVVKVEIS